ncbi:MAG: glycosyltransferase family 4 protein [Bacteroidetes bacterium]|nr:glycosyltransferase family 4 protein [Bacteroidota bacterium]
MGDNPARICMMADRHDLYDDRVYWKESLSLVRNGYSVTCILASDAEERGITAEGLAYVKIKKRSFSRNRYINFILNMVHPAGLYPAMFREAINLKADVYHFHDLNLNRVAKKLKKLPFKPKIIYDVHEPFAENILDYNQTSGFATLLKKLYADCIRRWEMRCSRKYDLIITTEENLRDRFSEFLKTPKVEIIYNYTDLAAFAGSPASSGRIYDAIYCGGITEFRGAFKILEAIKLAVRFKPDIKVLFLGRFFPAELKYRMEVFARENNLTENIVLKDAVPYHAVSDYYSKSRIGLGIFLPIRTHQIILQIKIFEYFTFGLPIIGSNFGHVKSYIEKNNAGITVNPESPNEIASALKKLLTNKELYFRLSKNARIASEHYRWNLMEEKLLRIYESLITNEPNDKNDKSRYR